MTRPDLKAIRERCEAASPAPWTWQNEGCYLKSRDGTEIICTDSCVYPPRGNPGELAEREEYARQNPGDDMAGRYAQRCIAEWHKEPKDAAFIAHARTDIPALLDYIEELEREFAELKEEIRDAGEERRFYDF